MQRSELQFQRLLDKLPAGAYTCDREGQITYFNQHAARLWGREPQLNDPTDRFCGSFKLFAVDGSPIAHEQCWMAKALHSDREFNGQEIVIEQPGGRRLTVLAHANPMHNPSGELVGAVNVLVDISDSKHTEEESRRAKEEAERANRAKSDFLSHMSHEIRTPMNGVLGMVELLLASPLSAEQRRYAEAAKDSADALLRIIDDILDLSKIEAGHVELESVPFSLSETLKHPLKTLALSAHQKGLDVVCSSAPDVPDRLLGDRTRLRQILVNLIGNAIKFTESGSIVLRIAKEAESGDRVCLRFSVTDTGIGIAREQQRQVFDPFIQVETGTARRYGGTGLGLSICARLAALMNGSLHIESEPGRGSTFHFSAELQREPDLPAMDLSPLSGTRILVAEHHPEQRRVLGELLSAWGMKPTLVADGRAALAALHRARQAERSFPLLLLDAHLGGMDGFEIAERIHRHGALGTSDVIVMVNLSATPVEAMRCAEARIQACLTKPVTSSELQEAILSVLGARSAPFSPIPAALPAPPPGRGLRILLAEDNPINQAVATAQLEAQGHAVAVVGNGAEAVALFAGDRFDVLLMDVQMPTMDGLEATRLIRAREKERGAGHVPIIAMTAQALSGDREECLAAGMDAYLTKPILTRNLLTALDDLCGAAPG